MKTKAHGLNPGVTLGVILLILAWIGVFFLVGQRLPNVSTETTPTPEEFFVNAEVSSIRYTGIPWDGYQIGLTVKVIKAERMLTPGQEYELWLPSQTLEGLKEGMVLRLRCNDTAGKDILCSDEYEILK